MGTTHIVTVGTRGSDNFGASAVTGNGPWTVWIGDPWNLDDTVVGDVMRDFFGRIYLITDMASDASWLKVRDINAAGGAAPYAGVGLLADGRTDRAYSGIGNAEMDIPDIVGPADDTWECHVYNDGMIFESTVWIDDQSLSQLGTIKITVPESERHTGKGGTGPVWAGTLPGFEFIFSYPSGPAGAPAHQLFEWLEIVAAFGGTLAVGVYIVHSGQSTVLRNLLVHQQVPDTSAYGIVIAAPDVDLINCAVFEVRTFSPSTAIGLLCFNSTGRTRVMNCTFDFCTSSAINYSTSTGLPMVVQNCAVFRSGFQPFLTSVPWDASSGFNCTDASTAPGSNNKTSQPFSGQFVQPWAGTDYHLALTSTCLGAGLDLSTEFTDDFEGTLRTGTWDIGADELGQTYYVDAEMGNTGFDGLQPARAWPSVAKVNSWLLLNLIKPGDTILFKRGQDFYGRLNVIRSGTSGRPITFGAYGPRSGGPSPWYWQIPNDWPRIGYDQRIDQGTGWTWHSGNTYRIALSVSPLNYVNYRDPADRDTTWLRERSLIDTISTPGSFFYDGATTLYVHLLDAPNPDPQSVHVYLNTDLMNTNETNSSMKVNDESYVTADGLHFICAKRGYRAAGASAVNCVVQNCLATGHHAQGYVGGADSVGSLLLNNEVLECGNGLGFGGAFSGKAEGNYVHDIDPTRTRWPTEPPGKVDFEGISIAQPKQSGSIEIVDNLIERVATDAIAVFSAAGQITGDIHIHRNTMRCPFSKGIQFSGSGTYPGPLVNHNLFVAATTTFDVGVVATNSNPPPTFSPSLKVINNTFIGGSAALRPDAPNVVFKNNISTDFPQGPSFLGYHIVHDTNPTTVGHERDNNCYHPVTESPEHKIAWGAVNYGVLGQYKAAAAPQEQLSTEANPELDASDFSLTPGSDPFFKSGGADVTQDLPGGTVDLFGVTVPLANPSLGAYQWVE